MKIIPGGFPPIGLGGYFLYGAGVDGALEIFVNTTLGVSDNFKSYTTGKLNGFNLTINTGNDMYLMLQFSGLLDGGGGRITVKGKCRSANGAGGGAGGSPSGGEGGDGGDGAVGVWVFARFHRDVYVDASGSDGEDGFPGETGVTINATGIVGGNITNTGFGLMFGISGTFLTASRPGQVAGVGGLAGAMNTTVWRDRGPRYVRDMARLIYAPTNVPDVVAGDSRAFSSGPGFGGSSGGGANGTADYTFYGGTGGGGGAGCFGDGGAGGGAPSYLWLAVETHPANGGGGGGGGAGGGGAFLISESGSGSQVLANGGAGGDGGSTSGELSWIGGGGGGGGGGGFAIGVGAGITASAAAGPLGGAGTGNLGNGIAGSAGQAGYANVFSRTS